MSPHPHVRREGREESKEGTPQATDRGAGGGEGASDTATASAGASTHERLSLVEVLVAELGGWTGAIVCRCHLPMGPFLVSDGVVHMDLAVFRRGSEERAEPPTPE